MPQRFFQALNTRFHVEREGDDLVLHCADSVDSAELQIFAAADPDAEPGVPEFAPELRSGHRLGLPGLAAEGRVYLTVVGPGGTERIAERLLPLSGPQNFRDLGGYPTQDGRRLRWGQVYRSDSLAELSDGDLVLLEGLGLQLALDLRSDDEVQQEPSRLLGRPGVRVERHPVGDASVQPAEIRRRFEQGLVEEFDAEWLPRSYARMLDTCPQIFGAALAALADPEAAPAVFHCTAGKDRTGVLSALLLSVLGVPRQVVVGDYSLTSLYTGERGLPAAERYFATRGVALEKVRNLMLATPSHMMSALDHLEKAHGGAQPYLEGPAGLGAEGVAALRARLLR